ncbi:hypothetical protein Droror1_Dr00005268 [Drosera rotundifolia]
MGKEGDEVLCGAGCVVQGTPNLGYLMEIVEGCLGVVVLDLVEGWRAMVRTTERSNPVPDPILRTKRRKHAQH